VDYNDTEVDPMVYKKLVVEPDEQYRAGHNMLHVHNIHRGNRYHNKPGQQHPLSNMLGNPSKVKIMVSKIISS